MNARIGKTNPIAFTLIELLVVLALIAILVILFSGSPGPLAKEKARRAACMANQRQIVLGLNAFAGTHSNNLPAMVSITNGGALEPMTAGDVVSCYLTFTNLIPYPGAFVCPSDKLRSRAQTAQSLGRTNVSYFISLDASLGDPPVTTILTGDRHLESNGKPVAPGVFALSTNSSPGWTAELHSLKGKPTGGNFGFLDGHVAWVSMTNLARVVVRQNMATNRVVVP